MKSLEELKELRERFQKDLRVRKASDKPKVIVGMDSCGIDAGAREILKKALTEISQRDLDVVVTQTACIGECDNEPTVTVDLPNEPKIVYGDVTVDKVEKIIVDHVVEGNIVKDLVVAELNE
ncbi:(2Fe-2S) ferredoxin domain-containing protein [Natroniella acetigena]|uniref:(2Fe-2S) ferredoxin domain-containing protein n=1 Tax=Natroniella acetigena TaxID=52004 RepID=UPI00200AAA5A|nr:(2Fe-2S) ferredoxin domain-containing protein [Natroniella acetigena]MCK8827009.1 (2Fe-2S) ferredoxin domain-containing protein [Natroniella acetigena]